MINETQQTSATEHKPIPFGTRLKTTRESLGLERKEAAAQLRLSEKVITMMEKDQHPSDLPITFIRGYLRSYAKLLNIPEHEIQKGLEPIVPKPVAQDTVPVTKPSPLITSGNYFMQIFTYLIVLTLISLVGLWWYTHRTSSTTVAENQMIDVPTNSNPAVNQPSLVNIEAPSQPFSLAGPKPAENSAKNPMQATRASTNAHNTNQAAIPPANQIPATNAGRTTQQETDTSDVDSSEDTTSETDTSNTENNSDNAN